MIQAPGKPQAAFLCPGHPLLDATLDLILERYRDQMVQGAVLVDEEDTGEALRALFYLDHTIRDARTAADGSRRTISRRLQFVECRLPNPQSPPTPAGPDPHFYDAGPAPYLDYRPLEPEEQALVEPLVRETLSTQALEAQAISYAIAHLAPRHLREVREVHEPLIRKTRAAVQERLTKEIIYWDHRAVDLQAQEAAGRPNARLNSALARQRADELQGRLKKRLAELEQERQIAALPPAAIGGALIVPAGLLARLRGERASAPGLFARETERVELAGMAAVLAAEWALGHAPRDVSKENRGYDVESTVPAPDGGDRARFLEVKGRIRGARTVTVSKNEILTAFNEPERWILALVEVPPEEGTPGDVREELVREGRAAYHIGDGCRVCYVRRPFAQEPDFHVTSVNYDWKQLWQMGEEPA